jgi:hypothetical protein
VRFRKVVVYKIENVIIWTSCEHTHFGFRVIGVTSQRAYTISLIYGRNTTIWIFGSHADCCTRIVQHHVVSYYCAHEWLSIIFAEYSNKYYAVLYEYWFWYSVHWSVRKKKDKNVSGNGVTILSVYWYKPKSTWCSKVYPGLTFYRPSTIGLTVRASTYEGEIVIESVDL